MAEDAAPEALAGGGDKVGRPVWGVLSRLALDSELAQAGEVAVEPGRLVVAQNLAAGTLAAVAGEGRGHVQGQRCGHGVHGHSHPHVLHLVLHGACKAALPR